MVEFTETVRQRIRSLAVALYEQESRGRESESRVVSSARRDAIEEHLIHICDVVLSTSIVAVIENEV